MGDFLVFCRETRRNLSRKKLANLNILANPVARSFAPSQLDHLHPDILFR